MAASAARSLGRRHGPRPGSALKRAELRLFFVASSLRAEPWSRFARGPLRGPCRRGRPCGFGPHGLAVCALQREARPRATLAALLSARLRRQNGGRGIACLGSARVSRLETGVRASPFPSATKA